MLLAECDGHIRSIRKPEHYKCKGMKYETETILSKTGKSGWEGE